MSIMPTIHSSESIGLTEDEKNLCGNCGLSFDTVAHCGDLGVDDRLAVMSDAISRIEEKVDSLVEFVNTAGAALTDIQQKGIGGMMKMLMSGGK